MYIKDDRQPPGIGLAYNRKNDLIKSIFFSNENSRVDGFKWLGSSGWSNIGGAGWYVVGPLSIVEWSEL